MICFTVWNFFIYTSKNFFVTTSYNHIMLKMIFINIFVHKTFYMILCNFIASDTRELTTG